MVTSPRGGRIAAVGEAPEDADSVIDARGGTVLPGLIDAHFHAYGIGLSLLDIERARSATSRCPARAGLERALRRGFTTVRDVAGGDPGLAKAIDEGLLPAPRYLYTGPALTQTGGHATPGRATPTSARAAATPARSSTASMTSGVPCATASAAGRTPSRS
jgi:imidazolonepropionase-like amidohydrolase